MLHVFSLSAGAPHHMRQTSQPSTTSLFGSTQPTDDFFSIGQPRSIDVLSQQQSMSAPAMTIQTILSSDSSAHRQPFTSLTTQEATPTPLDHPPSNADTPDPIPSISSVESFPFDRPPSNADIIHPMLVGSYPITNADFPPGTNSQRSSIDSAVINTSPPTNSPDNTPPMTHEHSNAPSTANVPGPKTNDEFSNDEFSNDFLVPRSEEIIVTTTPRVLHQVSEPVNIRASQETLNHSTNSLLDSSQEDFTSASPVRLLPPTPSLMSADLQSQPPQSVGDEVNGSLKDWDIINDAKDIQPVLESHTVDQTSLASQVAQAGMETATGPPPQGPPPPHGPPHPQGPLPPQGPPPPLGPSIMAPRSSLESECIFRA